MRTIRLPSSSVNDTSYPLRRWLRHVRSSRHSGRVVFAAPVGAALAVLFSWTLPTIPSAQALPPPSDAGADTPESAVGAPPDDDDDRNEPDLNFHLDSRRTQKRLGVDRS